MNEMRQQLKELLLEKSYRLGKFVLASGRTSDYYIDGRITSLDPEGAYLIGNLFMRTIKAWKAAAVGGLTLGADPIVGAVVALSHHIGFPVRGFIVRKQVKDHGAGKLVEGIINKGDRVVIVEDVVTSGSSAMKAVNAAKELGAQVVGVLAVVDREEGGKETILKEGLKFEALFTATELKKEALKRQNNRL